MPDDIEAGFRARRQAEDQNDLLQFLREEAVALTPKQMALQGALDEGAPPPKPAEKPSALARGAKAGVQALDEGTRKFLGGLSRLVLSGEAHPEDIGRGAIREVASGLAGKGAAVKQVVDGLFAIALSPGIAAGEAIQQFMKNQTPGIEGAIALPGGPGGVAPLVRAFAGMPAFAVGAKPEARAAMNAPMTVGELANIAATLAVPTAIHRGVSRLTRTEAPRVTVEPERLAREFRDEAPLSIETTAPEVTSRIVDAEGRPVELPTEREMLRTQGRTRLDEPSRVTAEAQPAAAPLEGEAPAVLDLAMRRAEAALAEELRAVEAKIQEGASVQEQTRAKILERAPEEPAKPAVAAPTEAERAAVEADRTTLMSEYRALREHVSDDSGNIDSGLIARVAVGAVLGGTQGDTPEEQIRNAFLGMGVGAVLSRQLATRAAAAMTDETGALLFDRLRKRLAVQAGERATQPNYERIDAPTNVTRLMKNVHRMFKQDIEAQKRGVVTLTETEKAAQLLIETGKMTPERILAFEPGTVLNDAEVTAARQVSIRAAGQAVEIAQKIQRGEPVTPGDLHQAIALTGAISKNTRAVQTELGRATGASRIKVNADTVGPIKADPDRLAAIADEIGRNVSERDLAEIVMLEAKEPEQVSRFSRMLTALPGAVLEAMYGSMLSGKALVRNAVGNLVVMPVAAWERTIAAYMPKWGSKLPGVLPSEGPQAFVALWEGLSDQIRMIRHLDWESVSAQTEAMMTRKIEGAHEPRITAKALALDDTPLGLAADWMGMVFRASLDVLNTTDAASKAVNGRMAIRWEAIRQAAKEGLDGEAFWNRVETLATDHSLLGDAALARVKDFRETQTFTKDFDGRILSAMQHGPENEALNLLYRLTAFTFVRTPLRLVEAGMVRTPGLNMLAAQFWRDWNAGGVDRQMAQARLVTGSAIVGSFTALAWQGLVTGHAPTDPKKRAAWEAAGMQETSWWDPLAKKYRSFSGMEPMSTLVATGADLANYIRELPEADGLHLFLAAVLSQIDNLNSKQYSQAISQLLDVIKNPRSDMRVDQAMEYIRRRLQTAFAVPLAGALREVESFVDPAVRRARPSGAHENPLAREWQALKDSYRVGIPFWSDAKDKYGNDLVPAERNLITGEVIVNESWPFNPFMARTPKSGPFWDELKRLKGAGISPLPDFIGTSPGSEFGMTTPDRPAVGVRLTGQEKDRWTVLMTQEIRDSKGRNLLEHLTDLVTDPRYQEQSDVRKVELVQNRWNWYREHAEQRLAHGRNPEAPKLADKLEQLKVRARIEKAPPAQQQRLREQFAPGLVIPGQGR